jgi:hypothetical protein
MMAKKVWDLTTKEVVCVPLAEDMDDETFIKHLELRHPKDVKMEGTSISRRAMSSWIGAYRAFHDRLHQIATPGQYDHYHEEDDE